MNEDHPTRRALMALETAQLALREIDDFEGIREIEKAAFTIAKRAEAAFPDIIHDFTWGLG